MELKMVEWDCDLQGRMAEGTIVTLFNNPMNVEEAYGVWDPEAGR